MKNEELVGLYILLLIGIADFVFTIAMGKLFTKPLSLLPSLFLMLVCIREVQKIKNTWSIIWLSCFVTLGISYPIILLVYGGLLERILVLLSPLSLSWIGIKKLRNKDRSDEISCENM